MSYFAKFLDAYLLRVTLFVSVMQLDKMTVDKWGNETPSVNIVPMQCYMKDKHSKGDRTDKRPGGAGINSVFLEGYLVDPMVYPQGVVPPFECDASISNWHGQDRQGKFYSLPRIPQPYEKPYTGERIAGWLTFNN